MNKIFIGYNERFIYDSLVLIYSKMEDVQITGGIENDKLLENISDLNFDILLLELGWVKHKEISFVSEVKSKIPDIPLLLLTSNIPPRTVSKLLKHEPDGFLLKSCTYTDLINSTKKIIEGSKFFCHKITQMLYTDMIEEKNHDNQYLTEREEDILVRIVNGETNYNIASDLNISETTVKTHRRNIMQKLGATNSFALVRYACRENLIQRISDEFCTECPCS